jgi:O-antigen/teichoic acid export membrane protein
MVARMSRLDAEQAPPPAPAPAPEPSESRVGVARATYLAFRADVATAISSAVVSVVVSRGLGPENRGIFFLAFSAAIVIGLVGDLGMSSAGIVYGANREIDARQLHGVALQFGIVVGLVGAGLLIGLQGFWRDTILKGLDSTMFVLLAAAVGPLLYAQVMLAVLTGRGRIPAISVMRIGQQVAIPALLAPAAVITHSPRWTLAGWLAARRGPATVGLYSLASVFAERIYLLGQAVYSASAERFGRDDPRESARVLAQIVRLLLVLMVPVAAVLAALGFPLIPLVFGSDFARAAVPFALLLPGTVALTIWLTVSLYILSSLRRPATTTALQAGALAVSVPLYLALIGAAGMNGAAVASSIVYTGLLAAGLTVVLRSSELRAAELIPRPGDLSRLVQAGRSALRRAA